MSLARCHFSTPRKLPENQLRLTMDMSLITMAKHALRLTANAWDVLEELSRTITRRTEMRPLRAAHPVRSRLAWLTAHDVSPQSVPGLYPGLVLPPRLSMNSRLNTRTRKMLPRILPPLSTPKLVDSLGIEPRSAQCQMLASTCISRICLSPRSRYGHALPIGQSLVSIPRLWPHETFCQRTSSITSLPQYWNASRFSGYLFLGSDSEFFAN